MSYKRLFVAIIGSRGYTNLDAVRRYVMSLPPNSLVISGGARGVDTVAEQTARQCGLPVKIFPADWNKHGKQAGYLRNVQIVEAADYVVAFWDGESKGTAHTIRIARQKGKRVEINPAVQS